MILLDFLFRICFAPFQKVNNGRFAALIWLVPPLGFIAIGIINTLLYYLNIETSPLAIGIGIIVVDALIFIILNKIYVNGIRDVGKIRFPVLNGFLIFVLIVGSLIFMSICLGKFRTF